jgi:DNA-binding transcriptional MerR regulator
MVSIGEFARLGRVSIRTRRHYDEIGLLHPASVDPETGYRCYAPSQLGQLNRIIALKELGLSLAQSRQLVTGITAGELRGMLVLRRAQLEQELETPGRAAGIFPMVYHNLFQWIGAHGFQVRGPGREIWLNEVDDLAEIEQQVFEVQLPFVRPEPAPA